MPAMWRCVLCGRPVLVRRVCESVREGDGGIEMKLEVRCRRCGRAFEPDRRAIVLGRWRLCPECQDTPPAGGVPVADMVAGRLMTKEVAQ